MARVGGENRVYRLEKIRERRVRWGRVRVGERRMRSPDVHIECDENVAAAVGQHKETPDA